MSNEEKHTPILELSIFYLLIKWVVWLIKWKNTYILTVYLITYYTTDYTTGGVSRPCIKYNIFIIYYPHMLKTIIIFQQKTLYALTTRLFGKYERETKLFSYGQFLSWTFWWRVKDERRKVARRYVTAGKCPRGNIALGKFRGKMS